MIGQIKKEYFLKMSQTSKSHIVHALRLLWLRSKERSEALKRAKYCCEKFGVKQSTAKEKSKK